MTVLVQSVSLLGAGLVLAAFFALQRGRWRPALGAGLLRLVTLWDRRLGFIVLEEWTATAASGLWRARARP